MGSIRAYETVAGRRYSVMYRKPDHSQGQKRGFVRKRDAQQYLNGLEASKTAGTFVDAVAGRVLVSALGPAWLASRSNLKPSSQRPLEIAWRLHVEPVWGRRAIADIRHSEVQSWVTELSATKSATTVLRAHGVLAGILDVAVRDRRLHTNVTRGVSLPRKSGKRRVYLNHAQVNLLALHAGRHATLVYLLAYTGLRWGEATGLRVRNVDLIRRRILVEENAVNVGGKITVGTPKSHEARSVPFPPFLSERLLALIDERSPEMLVFGDGVNHQRSPDTRRGWWVAAKRAATAADLHFPDVTLHDLRHTAASLAVSANANVKVVQRMLGHASAAMTLDTYADLFDDDLDAVAHSMEFARSAVVVASSLPEA
ncbi:site-specific integrase [Rathayibacter sp. AY1D1]|uniref:tyrosine-type recombinase/integrase n=1 Tax=Rathayibacter sp. AY1D1 TaxID=2080542 RepID=UPI000CE77CD3|nr:site-specific integrase [Rathayibacter sp. AY1D1]PPH98172.1 site-specific integrase [Rathayibacter sp. AY1D1]